MRGVRDNNAINGSGWLLGLDDCLETELSPCMIDVITDSVVDCNNISGLVCDPLKLRDDGAYNYSTGDDSIFTREVIVKEIGSGKEVRVDVTVKWNQGTSFPIESGHPCLGCSEPDFWDKSSFYQALGPWEWYKSKPGKGAQKHAGKNS